MPIEAAASCFISDSAPPRRAVQADTLVALHEAQRSEPITVGGGPGAMGAITPG